MITLTIILHIYLGWLWYKHLKNVRENGAPMSITASHYSIEYGLLMANLTVITITFWILIILTYLP